MLHDTDRENNDTHGSWTVDIFAAGAGCLADEVVAQLRKQSMLFLYKMGQQSLKCLMIRFPSLETVWPISMGHIKIKKNMYYILCTYVTTTHTVVE